MNKSNDELLLSVVMITYRHELYIKQAVEGVLMQETNFEFQLIISDDCSPDSTQQIVQNLIDKHPKGYRIKYFRHNKNIGMQPNGMFALKQCFGKYIAVCEGDDYWIDPLKLQKQFDFLEGNPDYSMCFHDAWVLKENIKLNKYVDKNVTVFTTEDLFERHFIPTASIVFKNNILIPDWYSKAQSGDRLLLFLISLKGKIKYLNETMSVYRLHSGGVSNTHFGIKKVYDSAVLLNLFDEETDFKYTKKCHESLLYEVKTHLKIDNNIEISPSIAVRNIKIKVLINEIVRRTFEKIRRIFP